jgi:predicted Rdx family selenoprotein
MVNSLYNQIENGRIQAGESLTAILEYSDFPRSAGWSLAVAFIGATGPAGSVTCTAGTTADNFTMTLPATTTAAWNGGTHGYTVTATQSTTTVIVAERGVLQVLPNPIVATQAMTILAAINAVVLGAASDDQLTVSVDGITLRYWLRDRGFDEVMKLQQRFQTIVENEIRQTGGGSGRYAIKHHAAEDYRLAAPWPGWPSGNLR